MRLRFRRQLKMLSAFNIAMVFSGSAVLAERTIELVGRNARIFRDLRLTSGSRNHAEGVRHVSGIFRRERFRHEGRNGFIGSKPLCGVEDGQFFGHVIR